MGGRRSCGATGRSVCELQTMEGAKEDTEETENRAWREAMDRARTQQSGTRTRVSGSESSTGCRRSGGRSQGS